jgi:hypothetical protein
MNRMGRCELDSFDPGKGPVTGSSEHGNGTWISTKAGNFLTS